MPTTTITHPPTVHLRNVEHQNWPGSINLDQNTYCTCKGTLKNIHKLNKVIIEVSSASFRRHCNTRRPPLDETRTKSQWKSRVDNLELNKEGVTSSPFTTPSRKKKALLPFDKAPRNATTILTFWKTENRPPSGIEPALIWSTLQSYLNKWHVQQTELEWRQCFWFFWLRYFTVFFGRKT